MRKFWLLILDIISLYLSLLITLFIRYRDNFSYQYDLHILPFIFIFGLWLLIFYIANLYDLGSLRNSLYFYTNLLKTITVASAISISFFYLIPLFIITPKTNLFIFIAISIFTISLNRYAINSINSKGFRKPIAIVGLGPQAVELAKIIKDNPQLGYQLKYLIDPNYLKDDNQRSQLEKIAAIKNFEEIDRIIKDEKINTIIISPEAYQIPKIIDTFYQSIEAKVTFKNLSSFYEQLTNKVPLGAINQVWFLENLAEGNKRAYEEAKRMFDILFAFIFGTIFIIFLPIIGLIIKLDSAGPIFYKQRRIGQNGKIFEIIKLRTMKEDAEIKTGAIWAMENDPRITRFGKILRKTRLDELPQLLNILKGEMSFVGPRAERPEFHDDLTDKVPFYEERYIIKPGLSGWAQINYRYGSSVNDAAEKLQYDLYYIKNRSLVLDLGIILKTINTAIRQAGR